MKYSVLKARIKILRKHSFHKNVGQHFYSRAYALNHWRIHQAISNFDVVYCQYPLDDYLRFLYQKNMRILLDYDIKDYEDKLK